jgi:NitT/TauT family transport system substrate-binding protein
VTCVNDATKYQAGYDVHQNVQRWQIESGDVDSTLVRGHGVGYEALPQYQPEYQLLTRYHLIKGSVNLGAIVNPTYVDAIYQGSSLIWPGP